MLFKRCHGSTTVITTIMLALLQSGCGGGNAGYSNPASTDQGSPPPVAGASALIEIVLAPAYTAISAAASSSRPTWPKWPHTGTAVVDGVGCYQNGKYHTHALLSIYQDGIRLALPGSIGRETGCEYELHTHEGSGTIHIETDVPKTFTLGQFLSLWGKSLSSESFAGLPSAPTYYVIDNEKVARVTSDPAGIILIAHREVVVITGSPPKEIPRYEWASSDL